MDKQEIQSKNRIGLFIVSCIFFVIGAAGTLLGGLSMINLATLHTSASSYMDYGYDIYFIQGQKVTASEFYSSLDDYYYSLSQDESELTEEDYIAAAADEAAAGFTVEHVDPEFSFNEPLFNRLMGRLWIFIMISGLIALISLVGVIIFTGTRLNFFDRLFSELQLAIALLTGLGFIPIYILLDSWFISSENIRGLVSQLFYDFPDVWDLLSWYSLEEYHGDYLANFFRPSWVLILLVIVGTLVLMAIILAILVSLIKKVKTHTFLSSTILGAITKATEKSIGKSKGTLGKLYLLIFIIALIFGILVFMASVSYINQNKSSLLIWCALLVFLLTAIFGYVNQAIKKYNMIREGLDEVQKGNTSYKIPDLGEGEFGRLAQSVNSITEAQNEAMLNELKSQRMRSELISNVSHDLRTPLTSMISYVDLLKSEGLDSPNAPKYLEVIREKTDRLHKLTDNLFEAAKASSGDIPVNIEKLDMDAMTRQAIAELEENLDASQVDVIYTCKATNTYVMADGNLLWRVIENLLTNVSKYAQEGTRAYVDIIDRGEKIAMEVKNMSRESLNISSDELMERFQRGDDSRNTDGSGLGLAIANDLTTLMKGEFTIHIDGDLFKATVELPKP